MPPRRGGIPAWLARQRRQPGIQARASLRQGHRRWPHEARLPRRRQRQPQTDSLPRLQSGSGRLANDGQDPGTPLHLVAAELAVLQKQREAKGGSALPLAVDPGGQFGFGRHGRECDAGGEQSRG